jgi:hypothetical protein
MPSSDSQRVLRRLRRRPVNKNWRKRKKQNESALRKSGSLNSLQRSRESTLNESEKALRKVPHSYMELTIESQKVRRA